MNAYLVRVGIDSTEKSGHFNAPVDLETMEFAYVPIIEKREMHPNCKKTLEVFEDTCRKFGVPFPPNLKGEKAHIDPDFSKLTYGDIYGKDSGGKINYRGKPLVGLNEDDWLVFYSGLKPIKSQVDCRDRIVDAIIGIYVVKESIQYSGPVEPDMRDINAHTRCVDYNKSDIVVIAKPNVSGRLDKCIPIGGYRNKAHRVSKELLETWGNIKVHDGYIQRSATLPKFLDPQKFIDWFENQQTVRNIHLIQRNN